MLRQEDGVELVRSGKRVAELKRMLNAEMEVLIGSKGFAKVLEAFANQEPGCRQAGVRVSVRWRFQATTSTVVRM